MFKGCQQQKLQYVLLQLIPILHCPLRTAVPVFNLNLSSNKLFLLLSVVTMETYYALSFSANWHAFKDCSHLQRGMLQVKL